MISLNIANREIHRFCNTTNFHMKSAAEIDQLASAIAERAEDEEEAIHAVSAWVEAERTMPTVADLLELLRAVRADKPERPRFSYGCPRCYGTGFETIYQLCTEAEGDLLRQTLPGGWREAQTYLDKWRSDPKPTGPNRYIGEAARKCGCRSKS